MFKGVKIEALDHFGRGIVHIDNRVVFVSNALPGEVVDIELINEKKSFSEARVIKYVTKSNDRIESICPYFEECGGCNLLFYKYEDTLKFKLNKVRELIKKNKVNYNKDIEVIKNDNFWYYRNKVRLKIRNGEIGYFKESSHSLVNINKCIIASEEINKVIINYKLLNINNGDLTIRCNWNNEILLVIEADDYYDIDIEKLKSIVKLVGVVYNDKLIFGTDFYYERIGEMLFKVSYNSFFQVNPFITEKLFKLVLDNIDSNSKVLDLYSGVGTLSIVASKKAVEVMGIEIIPNAVINATKNAVLNKRNNLKFMLGDVAKTLDKIKIEFDTLIVDPPRSGLDKKTLNYVIHKLFKKIIYVSCDVNTLMRDLKYLEELYEIKEYKILDMFSYSYHLENFVVLELK